jgi:multiple sugar transport system substrate-binding protein
MFTKFRSAMATGTYQFDLMNITSGWAGDFMGPGLVQPVPHDVLCTLNASNWSKFVAQSAQWNGKFQGVPLKGNTHLLWYRLDLFANTQYQQQFKAKYGYDLAPPKTWNQYYDVCQFFNTFSWNSTGKSYGCVETMGRAQGAVYFLIGRAAGYSKVPGDPNFFFDSKTMKPLINNAGWVQALTDFKKAINVGPPGAASLGFADTRPLFEGGSAAITVDWDDPMGLSLQSDSKITGKLGAALVPGGARLYNYASKQWQDTPQGNSAPFLAVTTWLWTVPKSAKYSAAAWDLVTFLNNQSAHPVLVATPAAAAAPTYDTDYALSEKYFIAEGATPSNVKSFLDAHKAGVENPNAVLDLRIPGGGDYYNALDTQFSRGMSGELTPQAALDAAYADWEGITDRLGRDSQLKAYIASLASS